MNEKKQCQDRSPKTTDTVALGQSMKQDAIDPMQAQMDQSQARDRSETQRRRAMIDPRPKCIGQRNIKAKMRRPPKIADVSGQEMTVVKNMGLIVP
jgi:hypothetical protein